MAHLERFAGATMFDWLEELVSQSRSILNAEEVLAKSALAGAQEAALAGCGFVVDSTFSGAPAHALAQVGLKGLVGLELFGLDGVLADRLFDLWLERLAKLTATAGSALARALASGQIRLTVAPHAPYTVAPALWARARLWAKERHLPITCHLAESLNEFNWIKSSDQRLHQYLLKVMPKKAVEDGEMQLDQMLKSLPWRGLGHSPTAHLQQHGLLDASVIAAHCLQLGDEDIKLLADHDVKIALCPRSNVLLKNGLPRPESLIGAGLTCGFGTDSRASSPSLSLLEEAHYLRLQLLQDRAEGAKHDQTTGLVPDYTKLLSMVTLESARAVGLQQETGSLTPGKCADIAVFNLDTGLSPEVSAGGGADEEALSRLFQTAPACRLLLIEGKAVVRDGRLV